MSGEMERAVQAFREGLKGRQEEPLVIYGTGLQAEAIVRGCPDFRIVGLMDAAKTGECLWGCKVLSEPEVEKNGIHYIVVAARPAVYGIIYKRIEEFIRRNRITLLDIHGEKIREPEAGKEKTSPYFKVSYKDLLDQIDSHEVVSFDVFDTLLARRVYAPADVFGLVDADLGKGFSFVFSEERKRAERQLQGENPTIYGIYRKLRENTGITEKDARYFMECELQKEKDVLVLREKMADIFQYCMEQGKEIYLVSDMYMTEGILADLLGRFGIGGYKEIIVSCQYGMSKQEGLLCVLAGRAAGRPVLHIGDTEEADYKPAIAAGLDAFRILSPAHMMELSVYDGLLLHMENGNTKRMSGMFACGMFNNPFALHGTQGQGAVGSAYSFGYFCIAPLVIAVVLWMLEKVKGQRQALLVFSARDGWLFRKVYRMLAEKNRDAVFPQDVYLLISREAVRIMGGEGQESGEARAAYRRYLDKLGLPEYGKVYFFDFMSRGTCQLGLEKLLGRPVHGLYVQKSLGGDREKDSLRVEAYFEEGSALEKDRRIFAMCDFLECIFTSPDASFRKIDADGQPVFEKETRPEGQRQCVVEIQEGVLGYCDDFRRMPGWEGGGVPVPEYCDTVLRFTEPGYTRTEVLELKQFILDGVLEKGKNVGADVFL